MNTQKQTLTLITVLIIVMQVVLTSCSSNKVVTSSFIQKRKYTNGYHFSHSSKRSVKEAHEEMVKTNTETVGLSETILIEEQVRSNGVNVNSGKLSPVSVSGHQVKKEMKEGFQPVVSSEKKEKVRECHSSFTQKSVGEKMEPHEEKKFDGFKFFLIVAGIVGLLLFMPGLALTFGIVWGIGYLCSGKGKKNSEDRTERKKGQGWKILGITLLALLLIVVFILFLVLLFEFLFSGFSMAPMC